jgi:hypothetical protein
MPQYPCPKCKAILKRDQPLPPGKKLRCPKCAHIFAPAGTTAKSDTSEEDDRNPYKVIDEKEEDEALKAEKERAARGLVRDRYEKSKRGPALKEVVRPSNFLLASGVINCTFAIVFFVIGIFPLVFRDFYATGGPPPPGKSYKQWEEELKAKGPIVMTSEEFKGLLVERILGFLVPAVCIFITGSLICIGAFKMRSLESYGWAMTGAIVCILFGILFGLFIGIWNVIVLSNQMVKDGFAEQKPPEV